LKFLLLNQTFYPDVASTAQHLSDLALALAQRGHEVTVLTSRRAYDAPGTLYPKHEIWRGIRIIRIGSTGFGKGAKWRRAADFGSFIFLCVARLLFLPRQDVVVALTSPPLISVVGAAFAKFRGSRFFYWVMDFNPDEAIAAGWLRSESPAAKVLDRMSRFSLRRAAKVIALDRFMRDRVVSKGIAPEKVVVLPPWSHDDEVKFDPAGREQFRNTHGLDGKFVVMYSGNHSPCHPLDTLMDTAERMKDDPSIVFCFIGGGSEFKRMGQLAEEGKLPNVVCLPYRPLSELAGSLSAADVHVVVMGNPFVGLVHPCKIYNIMAVRMPVIYIGPTPSHITEILNQLGNDYPSIHVNHGQSDILANQIQNLRQKKASRRRQLESSRPAAYSKDAVLPALVATLEGSDGG
jgi:colanic acid biosynthesis glycosyl transferase WcaI